MPMEVQLRPTWDIFPLGVLFLLTWFTMSEAGIL